MKRRNIIVIGIILFILGIIGIIFFTRDRKYSKYNSSEYSFADAYFPGDVNGNNKLDSQDYKLIVRHIVKILSLDANQLRAADVDGDGKVAANDYKIITRKIVNGETESPSGSEKNVSTYESGIALYSSSLVSNSYIVYDHNVLEYGADPTGVNDSTEAFLNAIHAVFNTTYPNLDLNNGIEATNKGGVVFVPNGKYRIDGKIILPSNVGLFGELKEGTSNGTMLLMNTTNSQIIMNTHSSVQNMAFYYPNQKIVSGRAQTKYPPTIEYGSSGTEGFTLDNLNFINSYDAIRAQGTIARGTSIIMARNIYGTPLNIGILNDTNFDTLRLENINFSKKYWLNSSIDNKPSESELNSVLNKAVAIQLQHVDWYYLTDINIEGYGKGAELIKSSVNGNSSEGVFYNYNTTNCNYSIYVQSAKHMLITNSNLQGNTKGLYVGNGFHSTPISINSSNVSSIKSISSSPISITNSNVSGGIQKNNSTKLVAVNTSGYSGIQESGLNNIKSFNYNKKFVTKPKSTKLQIISASNNEDITNKVQSAINLLSSSGGTVYIPAGTYNLSGQIDVKSGVEIRGSTPWLQNNSASGGTILKLQFKTSPSIILNSNSGINGIELQYPLEYRTSGVGAAIQGRGSNIYVINVMILNAYIGIDFSSYRCDSHYVDRIYGVFTGKGVSVGSGSSNGIIRDCHFHTNVVNTVPSLVDIIRQSEIAFDIGSSTNQILFNNFAWGPNIGINIQNGASNYGIITNGIDQGNNSIRLSGNNNGQIVNNMLVASTNNTNANYINTSNSSGSVDIINNMYWGNNAGNAFDFTGSQTLVLNGGILEDIRNIFGNKSGNLSMYGIIVLPNIPITISKQKGNICSNC